MTKQGNDITRNRDRAGCVRRKKTLAKSNGLVTRVIESEGRVTGLGPRFAHCSASWRLDCRALVRRHQERSTDVDNEVSNFCRATLANGHRYGLDRVGMLKC
jgi:hypothetical protein